MPDWVHSLLHWLSLHWGDVVPMWLAVIVAAFFGWLSWRSSVRSKAAEREAKAAEAEAKKQAERATRAAEESAAAEKRSADAAERSATAHETVADLAELDARAKEQKPWRIEMERGFAYLVNATTKPKYNVHVAGGVQDAEWEVVPGGARRSLQRKVGYKVGPIYVRWHLSRDRTDRQKFWHDFLPPDEPFIKLRTT